MIDVKNQVRIYEIPYSDLKNYVDLHTKTLSAAEGSITSSARFWNSKFDIFKGRLAEEDIMPDGYRFYFIRFDKECIADKLYSSETLKNEGEYSQMTVAAVPGKDNNGSLADIVNPNGSIWVLFPGGENTGLCPADCGPAGLSL